MRCRADWHFCSLLRGAGNALPQSLLIRSVKSEIALLLTKVTKPSLRGEGF